MNASLPSINDIATSAVEHQQELRFKDHPGPVSNSDTAIDLDALISATPPPALPQTATRLLEISQDPDKGPDDFVDVLQSDPALASQVLRFVNSSYFGFSNTVTSVKKGIALVGIRTIKNFVVWTAVFNATPRPTCSLFSVDSFRYDALRRAMFAKSLSTLLAAKDPDAAFTAALLQDIAVPYLVRELPGQYGDFLHKRNDVGERLSRLEFERFGWTHSDAANRFFDHWKLPNKISEMVRSHSDIDKLLLDSDRDDETVSVAVSSMLPAEIDTKWLDFERFRNCWQAFELDGVTRLEELLAEVDRDFLEILAMLGSGAEVRPLVSHYAEAYSTLATTQSDKAFHS